MADAPTHADLVAIAKAEMLANNSLLDPAAVDVEGHPASILVNSAAAMGAEVGFQLVQLEAQQFLDSARGDDLDLLVYDRYSLTRQEATPSVGSVAFSRATAGYGAITLPAGTVLTSTSGVRFQTIDAVSFGGSALGPLSATVRSVSAGAGQRALAGTITAFETAPADATITVTNAAATAGDADAETDAELRERARRYFPNAARGTLGAIEYGARQVPGVRFAVATEITTLAGEPARWVRLQVADRLGGSNATLAAQVSQELRAWRAAGMYVEVIGATVTYLTIEATAVISSAVDNAATVAAIKAAIVANLDDFKPGQTWYPQDSEAAAKAVEGVVNAVVTLPATAVAPATTEIFRTRPELVTIS